MDSAVEIMVWIGLGILLLGLMTAFIYNWNMKEDAKHLAENLMPQEQGIGFKTDEIGLARSIRDVLVNCSKTSVYVQSSGAYPDSTVTKERLFDIYKELGWCRSIQSAKNGCGVREDINMTTIVLPAVVSIDCINKTVYVR